MFEQFRDAFAAVGVVGAGGEPWAASELVAVPGYAEFAAEFAGATFGGGLYRVHDATTGPLAQAWVSGAFPELAEVATVFGYDWLGRQFAVDRAREQDGQPEVVMIEPGSGEALEIPTTFVGFHDGVLVQMPDAALAVEYFGEWVADGEGARALERHECVGYAKPLFLGGEDDVPNLEITELAPYWAFQGQLRMMVAAQQAEQTQQGEPGA